MQVQIHNDVTTVDWCNFKRGVYEEDLQKYSWEIYDSDDPIIVKMDKSKFSVANTNLEYALRCWHWIFSGIE